MKYEVFVRVDGARPVKGSSVQAVSFVIESADGIKAVIDKALSNALAMKRAHPLKFRDASFFVSVDDVHLIS